MGFNADAFAAAHRPWTLTLRGEEFTAVDPSADEVVRFRAEMVAAGDDMQAQRAVVRRFIRARFPWRIRYLWRGDPVGRFLALPAAAQEAALMSLFLRLGAMQTSRPQPKGRGNGSESRTATSTTKAGAPSPSRSLFST
jgi:hypothetical protein